MHSACPSTSANFPGSQARHDVYPALGVKAPRGQGWQTPSALAKLPAAHDSQIDEAGLGAKVPLGHGRQDVVSLLLYVLGKHAEQLSRPVVVAT